MEKHAYYQSPIGIIKYSYTDKINKIELVDEINFKNEPSNIAKKAHGQILEYLNGTRKKFDLTNDIDLIGTDFQKTVWMKLLEIPYGITYTYKDVALAIKHPKSIRAVANAIGANPIMIVIPCHRVIRTDGSIGGYEYGTDIKKQLLKIENS